MFGTYFPNAYFGPRYFGPAGAEGGGPDPEPEPSPPETVTGGFGGPRFEFEFPSQAPVDVFVRGELFRIIVLLQRGKASGETRASGVQIEKSVSIFPGKAEGVIAPLTEEEALIFRIAMLG